MSQGQAPNRPIYESTRSFLGIPDLVVSFYTRKCQFQCSYCALPLQSSEGVVAADQINAQIDWVFTKYGVRLGEFQQLCFGNEGSVLDSQRFHRPSLEHLLERTAELPRLAVLSLETRPEYIHRDRLLDVRARTHASLIDLTVGFETQDDSIRLGILNKKTSRRLMEERIRVIGELGMRLTSYVMIKPAPRMSEEHGVREAIATIEYLAEVCTRYGAEFVAYLTPTYIAEGSQLARATEPGDWTPPTIQSVYRVAASAWRMGIPTYCGLWSEGLASDGNDYRGHRNYDPAVRQALLKVNRTGDPAYLAPFEHLLYEPSMATDG